MGTSLSRRLVVNPPLLLHSRHRRYTTFSLLTIGSIVAGWKLNEAWHSLHALTASSASNVLLVRRMYTSPQDYDELKAFIRHISHWAAKQQDGYLHTYTFKQANLNSTRQAVAASTQEPLEEKQFVEGVADDNPLFEVLSYELWNSPKSVVTAMQSKQYREITALGRESGFDIRPTFFATSPAVMDEQKEA